MNNIDTILYIDPTCVNEVKTTGDERMVTTQQYVTTPQGLPYYREDPSLWSQASFGQQLQSGLNGLGKGWNAEVTDFKKYVVAKVEYHNVVTGRTSGKTFLIIFNPDNSGIVMNTQAKWRSISGYSQALSYISSCAQSLRSETNNRI